MQFYQVHFKIHDYKPFIKGTNQQTRAVGDFKEKYLQALEYGALKWQIFVP